MGEEKEKEQQQQQQQQQQKQKYYKVIYYEDVKGSAPIYIKKDNSALIHQINNQKPNYAFGL